MKCRVKEIMLFVVRFNQNRIKLDSATDNQSKYVFNRCKTWIKVLVLLGISVSVFATPTFRSDNGHYYEAFTSSYTFDDAVSQTSALTYCSMTAHLVTITDSAEQAFIIDSIIPTDPWCILWIGGKQNPPSTKQWITNEIWSYENFKSGDPASNHYGISIGGSGYSYKWMGQISNQTLGNYIVEYEGTPEIKIQGGVPATEIVDKSTSPVTTNDTDFGNVVVGSSVSKIFTIENSGVDSLALAGSPAVVTLIGTCTGFSIIAPPTSSCVAPNDFTTFTIRYSPTTVGTQPCTVSIANNDSDENPYSFSIQGTGVTPPEIDIQGNNTSITDGDTTPNTTDHTDFGNTSIGTPISKIFTLTNTGEADLNLPDKPPIALVGGGCANFNVTIEPTTPVAAINGTTNFSIEYKPIAVGTHTCTVSIANDDLDENPYDFNIQGSAITPENEVTPPGNGVTPGNNVVTLPEIDIKGNGTSITDGDTTPRKADNTDFDNTPIGTPVSRTFTIINTVRANLNLSGKPPVALTGADCNAFQVTTQPTTPIAAADDTTFTIEYHSSMTGTHSCTVNIPNDDSNENPYNFSISGKTTLVANNDSASTTLGNSVKITVLDNDSVPKEDLPQLQVTKLPLNGTVTVNSDNTISYLPKAATTAATDSFIYQLCDNDNSPQCTTATVTIMIATQLPPVAEDLNVPITFNHTVVQLPPLVANDLDGTVRSYTIMTLPLSTQGILYLGDPTKEGQLVSANQEIKPDQVGQLFFQPANYFIGTTSFTYVATDNSGAISNAASVTIPVEAPINQPPLAQDDTGNTLAEIPVIIPILSNDSDPEGHLDADSLIILEPPSHGIVEINSNKTVSYIPNPDFTSGTDIFSYQVCDTDIPLQCAQATASITVAMPANLPPIADDKTASTPNDTSVLLPPLSATDTDGSIISYLIKTLPLNNQGILYLGDPQATGQFIELEQKLTPDEAKNLFFQPHPDTVGKVAFNYLAIDDQGEPSTAATVTISVTAPPVIIDEVPTVTYQPPPTAIDDAQFSGKIWSSGGKVGKQLSVDAPEFIQITGTVRPGSKHIGQLADIRVIYDWKSDPDNLLLTVPVTIASQQPLTTQMEFSLFKGYLIGLAGQFEIRLGYQLNNGTVLAAPILSLKVEPNRTPTDINLSHQAVLEYSPINTLIGSFTTTDLDNQEQFRYGLVANPGNYFKVVGDELRVNYPLPSQEEHSTYPITVCSIDRSGDSLEKSFLIEVINAETPPQDLYLTQNTILENSPSGTIIGRLWTLDSQLHHYSYELLDDAQSQFILKGDLLQVAPAAALDFETQPTYEITVRRWKTEEPQSYLEKTFTIRLINQVDVTILRLDHQIAVDGQNQNEATITIQLLPDKIHQGNSAKFVQVMLWQPLTRNEVLMYRLEETQWVPWQGDLAELLTNQVVTTLSKQHEMVLTFQPPFDWNPGEINFIVGYWLPTGEIFYTVVPGHSTLANYSHFDSEMTIRTPSNSL